MIFVTLCFVSGLIAGSAVQAGWRAWSARRHATIALRTMPLRLEAVKRAFTQNSQDYEFIVSAPPPAR